MLESAAVVVGQQQPGARGFGNLAHRKREGRATGRFFHQAQIGPGRGAVVNRDVGRIGPQLGVDQVDHAAAKVLQVNGDHQALAFVEQAIAVAIDRIVPIQVGHFGFRATGNHIPRCGVGTARAGQVNGESQRRAIGNVGGQLDQERGLHSGKTAGRDIRHPGIAVDDRHVRIVAGQNGTQSSFSRAAGLQENR